MIRETSFTPFKARRETRDSQCGGAATTRRCRQMETDQ